MKTILYLLKNHFLQWIQLQNPDLEALMVVVLKTVSELRALRKFYDLKKSQRPKAKVTISH